VIEGEPATFEVDLGGTSNENIMIEYTVGGTDDDADNDVEKEDYTAPSGKLTIRAGASTGTIVIRTEDDDLLEPAEALQVTLDTASPSTVIEAPSDDAMTTIRDSGRAVTVSVAGPRGEVIEGREAVFTVTLSGKVSKDVPVRYAVDGTAVTDPLTIEADDTTGTITITPPDNMMAGVQDADGDVADGRSGSAGWGNARNDYGNGDDSRRRSADDKHRGSGPGAGRSEFAEVHGEAEGRNPQRDRGCGRRGGLHRGRYGAPVVYPKEHTEREYTDR
jgi:hypothetical protein